LVAGAAIVALVAVGVLVMLPEDEVASTKRPGCDSDAECKPGTSCIGRGCLILLSAEDPVLWRDDVKAQLDPQLPWKPRNKFGQKLPPAARCPAAKGKGIKPDESRTTRVLKVSVYEISGQGLRLYQRIKAKSNMWLDALRLWFPTLSKIASDRVCASPEVDSLTVGSGRWRGRNAQRIDLALKRAVPAETVTGAAVSVEAPLPPAAPDGSRLLDLGLDPVFESGSAEHTVVALPLGADLTTIDGPPPVDQRLLTGYVAYYWQHGRSPSELAIRFRVPDKQHRRLDLAELSP
jgi:hypothetical protein